MAGLCGSCTACCRVYAIPEIRKPAGTWCTHCAIGEGCKVYEARPTLCVEFKCLWLQSQARKEPLADELRPDRCKVVFSPTINEDGKNNGLAAITMPGMPDAWRKGAARRLIDNAVSNGLTVIAGPPATTRKVSIDKYGEREVAMTAPDENGMQWSIRSQ
jgi:hypothetical protein